MATSPWHIAVSRIQTATIAASGAIATNRLVGYDGKQATVPGQLVYGISQLAVADKEDATLTTDGEEALEVGAAIPLIGLDLTTDSQGRAVPAKPGDWVFGRSMQTASGAGKYIRVQITREGFGRKLPIITASGAIAQYRAVGFNLAQATVSGQAVYGFAQVAAANAAKAPLITDGETLAEAGAAIASVGTALMVNASGKVITATTGGNNIIARNLETAAGDASIIRILITREGVTAAS